MSLASSVRASGGAAVFGQLAVIDSLCKANTMLQNRRNYSIIQRGVAFRDQQSQGAGSKEKNRVKERNAST